MGLFGIGMGLTMQVLVLAVQNSVPYSDLGVATSAATFFRSIGGSLGVAVFGSIFANPLAAALKTGGAPLRQLSRSATHKTPAPLQGLEKAGPAMVRQFPDGLQHPPA